MKLKVSIIGILILICTGCIFSSDDLHEIKLVDNYYVSSSGSERTLIYKTPGASTEKVIYENVDSVATQAKFIFGVANNEYFIYQMELQNVIKYSFYPDFVQACEEYGINKINLKKSSEIQ
ncbi:MAG: hypothetical protein JWP69_1423 [Flaviaesturariibacter sp.]|nr:hypothetical protein [Flaviaesturariibacter sp.]